MCVPVLLMDRHCNYGLVRDHRGRRAEAITVKEAGTNVSGFVLMVARNKSEYIKLFCVSVSFRLIIP